MEIASICSRGESLSGAFRMKIRNIFLLLVLILMGVFLVINWGALSTEMSVNLS